MLRKMLKKKQKNKPRHPGGRPTKFTPEARKKIIDALRAAASFKGAADYARISYRALRGWIEKGEKEQDGEFSQFFQDVREALGSLEVRSLASIQKTGLGGTVVNRRVIEKKDGSNEVIETFSQPQWQALAWIMEHRLRDRWGGQLDGSGAELPGGQPLMTLKRETIDIYDPNRLARLIGAFAEADIIPEEILARFSVENTASPETHEIHP